MTEIISGKKIESEFTKVGVRRIKVSVTQNSLSDIKFDYTV